MPTARIRNYIKKNPETIELWRTEVLKLQIVKELSDKYAGDSVYRTSFNLGSITSHGGQNKICNDILSEHFELAHIVSSNSGLGYVIQEMYVYEDIFDSMIEGVGVKPVFSTVSVEKKSETDIYELVKDMGLPYLVYIYQNQEEFCFITKEGRNTWSCNSGLGVFFKDQKDDADNMAFRNALDGYYDKKLNVMGDIVCGKEFPDLVKKVWGTSSEHPAQSYSLVSYHENLYPENIEGVNIKNIDTLIANTQFGIETLQKTMAQLQELQASIKEAGGDKEFRIKYYEKMLDYFYKNIPLFLNVDDEALKALAKRAAKKKFT